MLCAGILSGLRTCPLHAHHRRALAMRVQAGNVTFSSQRHLGSYRVDHCISHHISFVTRSRITHLLSKWLMQVEEGLVASLADADAVVAAVADVEVDQAEACEVAKTRKKYGNQ